MKNFYKWFVADTVRLIVVIFTIVACLVSTAFLLHAQDYDGIKFIITTCSITLIAYILTAYIVYKHEK